MNTKTVGRYLAWVFIAIVPAMLLMETIFKAIEGGSLIDRYRFALAGLPSSALAFLLDPFNLIAVAVIAWLIEGLWREVQFRRRRRETP